MKILIVDPDARRVPPLQLAFATNGAEVTVAPSGSFALTMLEWNRHDVVMSRARIDDMDGPELCAILKSDPGMRDVRFVLVAGNDDVTPAQTTAAGVDLMLPPTLSAAAMVPLVLRVVTGEPPAPAPAAPPAAPRAVVEMPVVPAPPVAAAVARTATPPAAPPAAAVSGVVRSSPPAGAPVATAVSAATPTAPAPTVPSLALAKPVAPIDPVVPPPLTPPTPASPPDVPAPVAAAAPGALEPTVPKLKPDPVAKPVADPPKRYVTAAAAAAAAPWTKATAITTPPATPPPPPPINLDAMPSGTFQGSLEVMDLAELTQAIAMGGKNGRLILALPQGGGVVAFEGGQVVHAEYRGTVGEAAFAALLTAAHTDAAGRFCFLPALPGEKVSAGRTIDKSVDRLLLSIATAIDEKG